MSDFEMDLLDNGSDDSEGSSQSEKEAANSHTEICLFGNTTVELPLELVESVGTTHMLSLLCTIWILIQFSLL